QRRGRCVSCGSCRGRCAGSRRRRFSACLARECRLSGFSFEVAAQNLARVFVRMFGAMLRIAECIGKTERAVFQAVAQVVVVIVAIGPVAVRWLVRALIWIGAVLAETGSVPPVAIETKVRLHR